MISLSEILAELDEIYASKSWKITAPLRWMASQFRLIFEYGLIARAIILIRRSFRHLIKELVKRPKIKQFGKWILKRSKKSKKLESFYYETTINTTFEDSKKLSKNPIVINLNEDAQEIYMEIKNSLENKRES